SSYSEYEIVIVDDASFDNSVSILENSHFENLTILKNKKNYGQSYSLRKGVKSSKYNLIVTLDGDMQNNPYDIPKLLKIYENEQIKLVGGIRSSRKDSLIKIISSYLANYIRNYILKDDCKDTGCSLKVFDRDIFLQFPYFDGLHRFLPALFKGYGHKTSFIDVDHRKRYMGNSNYGTISRLFWGIRDIFKVLKILSSKNNE
ncbi:glycosyltransferase, partial [Alphaproteobacteria bacterium]|nr:glycosyltransferase [Alphaproteobacteria bacterium]